MGSLRFLLISTHTEQTTGYAKVSYNLLKQLATLQPIVKVFHFGFQKKQIRTSRPLRPLPEGIIQYDAALNEMPQEEGFGFNKIQEYIEMVNPDIVMIYNDALVVNKFMSAMGMLKEDAEKPSYKLWVYLDQVYNGINCGLIDNIDSHADYIFTFTETWKERLVKNLNKCKNKVSSMEHGFDRTIFKPLPQVERTNLRKNLGIPEDAIVFLNANRNTERKRLDITICAFVELLSRNEEASIILFFLTSVGIERGGHYDLNTIYLTELKRHGLDVEKHKSRLIMLDTSGNNIITDDLVNQIYNITNIGLNTSNGEGYGLCQLEHLVTGAPQVVADVGDYRAFMDETCGVFVKPTGIEYLPGKFGLGTYSECVNISDFADGMEKALQLQPIDCIKHVERKTWARVCDPFLEILAQ